MLLSHFCQVFPIINTITKNLKKKKNILQSAPIRLKPLTETITTNVDDWRKSFDRNSKTDFSIHLKYEIVMFHVITLTD